MKNNDTFHYFYKSTQFSHLVVTSTSEAFYMKDYSEGY